MTGKTATFVYDGDCAFCTSCAEFIGRHIPTRAAVVPWQFVDIDSLGVTADECAEAVQWVGADGSRSAGPEAIAHLLRSSGRGWRPVGWLLARRPVLALARPAYRWVARNRHHMPGGTAACAVPQPTRGEHRSTGQAR